MADHYSEHFAAQSTATSAPPTALADPTIKAPPGAGMAKVQVKRARVDMSASTIAAADVVRLFSMKSGDRILSLKLSNDSTWAATALTVNVGLWAHNETHTGAAAATDSEEIFASAVDLAATNTETDVLVEAAHVEDHHRGLPLWEMLALDNGSDTVDPIVQYDIGIEFQTVTTVTVQDVVYVECAFIAAGAN